MRISKKFAGQNIGKHTFIRKGLSSCSSPTSITSPHLNENRMTIHIESFPKFRKISRNHRIASSSPSASSSIDYYHSPSPATDFSSAYEDEDDECSVISTDSLLSDDSLSSSQCSSSSVETEAEEWKAVLQFYCGKIGTSFTFKKNNKRTLSEGSELTTCSSSSQQTTSQEESLLEDLKEEETEADNLDYSEDELALIFDL
jgi:hypothetical protein